MRNPLLLLFIFTLFLLSCSGKRGDAGFQGNVNQDIENLLYPGEYEAEVMDSIIRLPREQELDARLTENIQDNYEWYNNYLQQHPGEYPLPYHPNFGISEAEYNELNTLKKNIQVQPSYKGTLKVVRDGGFISFQGTGKLQVLNKIRFEVSAHTVYFDRYILSLSDTLHITSENHGLKSAWDGYTWRFTDPENIDMETIKNPENLTAKHYNVTLGQLKKNHKTLLRVTQREMVNGETITNLSIPVVF